MDLGEQIVNITVAIITGLLVYEITYNRERIKYRASEQLRIKQELVRYTGRIQYELLDQQLTLDTLDIRLRYLEAPFTTTTKDLNKRFLEQVDDVYGCIQNLFEYLEKESEKDGGLTEESSPTLTILRMDLHDSINHLQEDLGTESLSVKALNGIKGFINPNFYNDKN